MKLVTDDLSKFKSKELVPLYCEQCNDIFYRTKSEVKRAMRGTRAAKFCSLKCAGAYKTKNNTIECTCVNCDKKIIKKNSELTIRNFCDHSCSATYNNKLWDRSPKGLSVGGRISINKTCPLCKGKKTRYAEHCIKCRFQKSVDDFGTKLIKEFSSTFARHRYQKIRNHAHRVMKLSKTIKICKLCGYSKHAELCHIKSISTFPEDTPLSIVNHPNNLAYLCPTHHWELDSGLIISV